MQPCNPIDQIFLRLEGRNQPMHVGGLQLYSLPEGSGPEYVRELVADARCFDDIRHPFNQRLKYRLGQPFWQTDSHFDLEYHVRHLALPEPGAIRDLLALVSMLHGALLDRSRPMWEVYFIEGVADDRFAIYTKLHHAVMDGMSAMKIVNKSHLREPDRARLRVPWQLPEEARPRNSSPTAPWQLALRQAQAAAQHAKGLPAVGRELFRAWQDAHDDPDFTSIGQAPACILNRRISGSRRFAAQSYSLTRIKRLAQHYDTTVNDMILAMSASALRTYLMDLNALPQRPLVGMVPVSLHSRDDDSGNKVAMIFTSLATDVADPVERLYTIQRCVNHWKHRYKKMTSQQILAFTAAMSAPAGLNLLSGLAPQRQSFNVVISNVPGPNRDLYFGDARLEGMYPVSIVLDGMALNITITSYRDKLEFGLIACRRSLPSMQHLLQYLADALDALDPESVAAVEAADPQPTDAVS